MPKKPKDIDIWTAFATQLDHGQLRKQKHPIVEKEGQLQFQDLQKQNQSPEWDIFIRHMDNVNRSRNTYVPKQSVNHSLQITRTYQDVSQLPEFIIDTLELDIQPLDRQDKKQLHRTDSKSITVVDLHGYTLQQGYERLKVAFQYAVQQKTRILKVITGKGRQDPEADRPTLRYIFPKWMQEPYFYSKLIKIRKAPSNQGGDGAFLVFLGAQK